MAGSKQRGNITTFDLLFKICKRNFYKYFEWVATLFIRQNQGPKESPKINRYSKWVHHLSDCTHRKCWNCRKSCLLGFSNSLIIVKECSVIDQAFRSVLSYRGSLSFVACCHTCILTNINTHHIYIYKYIHTSSLWTYCGCSTTFMNDKSVDCVLVQCSCLNLVIIDVIFCCIMSANIWVHM